ncbi:MAG: ketopantoate reductase family protein [Ignavibacteria bacterium]|nr:ketopantoate reductase family protein [Ignavibacteria bacterium]
MNKPKILIAGTGAVGGYFGGRLAQNKNHKVYFLSRGITLQLLKKKGLSIKSTYGDFNINIKVSDNPSSFKTKFDYVIVSVKSQDTEALIPALKKVTTKDTQFISVQNGIYNYNVLKKAFGKTRVLQGISRIATEMNENKILHTALGIIVIGEENGKVTKRLKSIYTVLNTPGIKCKMSENIKLDIWVKLAWNTIFNSLTAIALVEVDELFKDKKIISLINDLYKEISEVAASVGVIFTNEAYEKVITDTKKVNIAKTSSYQDRLKGKKLETGYFTSEILKIAQKNKIETPHLLSMHMLISLL